MSYVQTIHVIDDDAMMRDSFQTLLRIAGYVVQSHDSAQAFLNTFQNDDVGCIVTDQNMPQMSGTELLHETCRLHMCMPAIVISGLMDARLNQESKEQGAFRCFQKPVDLDILLAAIHAALVQVYGGDQNPTFSS